MRKLISTLSALLFLASASTLASPTELLSKQEKTSLKSRISKAVKARIKKVSVKRIPRHVNGYEVSATVNASVPYSVSVLVTGVTRKNVKKKLNEAVAIITSDIQSRKRAGKSIVLTNTQLFDRRGEMDYTNRGAGITLGTPFASVWMQIPVVEETFRDKKNLRLYRSRWLKTLISLEGTLTNPDVNKPMLLTRIETSLWEGTVHWDPASDAAGFFSIRLGTVRLGLKKVQEDNSVYPRLDVDVASASVQAVFGAAKNWPIKPFLNATMDLGFRALQDGKKHLEAQYRQRMDLGLILADRFFVYGNLSFNMIHKDKSKLYFYTALGGGWRISRDVTITAEAAYRFRKHPLEFQKTPYDEYILLPYGWSFKSSILFQF